MRVEVVMPVPTVAIDGTLDMEGITRYAVDLGDVKVLIDIHAHEDDVDVWVTGCNNQAGRDYVPETIDEAFATYTPR